MHAIARLALVALLACGVLCSSSFAYPGGLSVGVNFSSGQPGTGDPVVTSEVTGPAGVLGSVNWNNLTGGESGARPVALVADDDGSLVDPSGVSIRWESNGTWASTGRGEENNTAPEGDDRNLMTGYLDTSGSSTTSITVDGLPGDPFDVAVYIKGGVNGRGGLYTIEGATRPTQPHLDTAEFNGKYVGGHRGDVIVFRNLSGPTFTLTSTPDDRVGDGFRAPINAIEIAPAGVIRIPEPSSALLALLAALSVVAMRRHR